MNRLTQSTQKLRRISSQEVDVSGEHQHFLHDIIFEAKSLLQVDRVSVWLFDDMHQPGKLLNYANTDWQDVPKQLPVLSIDDFPVYFSTIISGQSIAADNACSDPRTSEFTDIYLKPNNIAAMLDTAIFKNGIALGVVCCEGRAAVRQWQEWEVSITEMVADCCSRRLLVHELYQMQQKLTKMAFQDMLTGLNNRRFLMEHAKREMSRHQRTERPMSLIMVDLDRFKRINDDFGHDAGDKVLQKFAQCCLDVVRVEDCFCRLGGEEFVVLLPETSVSDAHMVANRLCSATREMEVRQESGLISVTASFGVTEVNTSMPFSHALKMADQAVYRAKANGRDQIQLAY
ncbi:sensor domain-containing diguanylate cyclase [Pseudoalteromonas sp. OOF1S-7]|uniref:sensor domain-containing diguanylate cyclase n=1 Tax=Pseudoalteromonas sp. OOF1S-7 TaxID=2917757 RepID=UPI001EF581CA|nr:sensor domain-containing diguanylate cyclase [Pseudoalteromonas sp. OOF1S-7]MCG7536257.1 sensor domain-containing diguanylate cyclase [Pseudoalteromonas sp. OOF1S-7]